MQQKNAQHGGVMKALMKMSKEEMAKVICEMEETLAYLEDKLNKKVFKAGRKEQVLKILQSGAITVGGIATRIGISARNVSSQLTYLRSDGYDICTSSTGKKFLAPAVTVTEVTE